MIWSNIPSHGGRDKRGSRERPPTHCQLTRASHSHRSSRPTAWKISWTKWGFRLKLSQRKSTSRVKLLIIFSYTATKRKGRQRMKARKVAKVAQSFNTKLQIRSIRGTPSTSIGHSCPTAHCSRTHQSSCALKPRRNREHMAKQQSLTIIKPHTTHSLNKLHNSSLASSNLNNNNNLKLKGKSALSSGKLRTSMECEQMKGRGKCWRQSYARVGRNR